ncbi:EAL domain-containing protein [Fulvimarina sp. MAC8]|uniref:putative bifunctional diguanylate cyclase/phosphodiesterase n=1 Tax=Fulvimarina sp. MAC8 TaxID=3162874 RepID=UPI0032EB687F
MEFDKDERHRLAVLAEYAIFDTLPEAEFDHATEVASHVLGAPIALVSLVGKDRQFFKARTGLAVCETEREASFCRHALWDSDILVVPDATQDPRFSANRLVTGEPFIRFYAGAPLRNPDGVTLGTLCVIDREPRTEFSESDRRTLRLLADGVMDRLEARRLKLKVGDVKAGMQSITSSSPDAIITADHENRIISWNAAAERMFGHSRSEAVGQSLDLIVPPAMREAHGSRFHRVASGEPPRLLGTSVELTACRKDGSEFPIELSLSRWMEAGQVRFGGIVRDISGRKKAEEELRLAAVTDHLTGLSNRASLADKLATMERADARLALLLIDLDGFKDVNDTLGHLIGDEVLKEVGLRLRALLPPTHFVARMGGDEFVVLVEDNANPMDAYGLADTIISAIEEAMPLGSAMVSISASVGIACTTEETTDHRLLLGDADLALYKAKGDGRGRACIFTRNLRHAVKSKGLAREQLATAWKTDAFELYYQPQVDLSSGAPIGAEALLRWNHPDRGLLAPGAFISLLESDVLAAPVGRWILETACRQAAEWRQTICPGFRVAVNLFPVQFKTDDLPTFIHDTLEQMQLSPDGLEIEITETTILKSDQRILSKLKTIRDMGVAVAFDDFGTGYASLSMLRDYPVTKIKIDRSFVSGNSADDRAKLIAKGIAAMAANLDLVVVAEGIETREQHERMRDQGCDHGQGYLYGRPMRAMDYEKQVSGRTSSTIASVA